MADKRLIVYGVAEVKKIDIFIFLDDSHRLYLTFTGDKIRKIKQEIKK